MYNAIKYAYIYTSTKYTHIWAIALLNVIQVVKVCPARNKEVCNYVAQGPLTVAQGPLRRGLASPGPHPPVASPSPSPPCSNSNSSSSRAQTDRHTSCRATWRYLWLPDPTSPWLPPSCSQSQPQLQGCAL